jgi:hypothetical protein
MLATPAMAPARRLKIISLLVKQVLQKKSGDLPASASLTLWNRVCIVRASSSVSDILGRRT